MLKIHTMPVGMLQTNCYIVSAEGSDRCIVIDPGDNARGILAYLEQQELTLEAILLTHGHFDHDGGVKGLMMENDCDVYLHQNEMSLPARIPTGARFHTRTYDEGDVLNVAGLSVQVLLTPGHTPGSVSLVVEDAIFSGDTLFAGSCGRTDFPGGNGYTILQSLGRLAQLPGDYRVFPGHGEETTLERERRTNPYLRG